MAPAIQLLDQGDIDHKLCSTSGREVASIKPFNAAPGLFARPCTPAQTTLLGEFATGLFVRNHALCVKGTDKNATVLLCTCLPDCGSPHLRSNG